MGEENEAKATVAEVDDTKKGQEAKGRSSREKNRTPGAQVLYAEP